MAMVSTFLDSFFISFSIVIYSIYFLMGLLSMYKLVHYNKTNKMVDYSVLVINGLPSVIRFGELINKILLAYGPGVLFFNTSFEQVGLKK